MLVSVNVALRELLAEVYPATYLHSLFVRHHKPTCLPSLTFSLDLLTHCFYIFLRFPAKMPRVISYTPSWLSRPSPGFDLFASKSKASTRATNGPSNATECSDPHRTIACRGSEIFVAAGNEIRWSDLVLLQETGSVQKFSQSHSQAGQTTSRDEIRPYRVSANNATN